MISTTLALIAATLAADATPVHARMTGGSDPITAAYIASDNTFCIRSGWNTATFKTSRMVKAGDCRTASAWRDRGIEFDADAAARVRPLARNEVAAR